MSSVYRRAGTRFLWVSYYDAFGERQSASSETEDEAEARKRLEVIERRVRAEKAAGLKKEVRATVRWYAEERWLPGRRKRGVRSARDDEKWLKHILPTLGEVLLKELTREMLVTLMAAVAEKEAKGGGLLAPRSVRHVYATVRVMLNDALADGLIPFSPATLKVRRGELPKKRDKNLRWRSGAIFSRREVELLISDPRVPEYRRVLWGLLFLGCLRVNEATPRRWRDYDQEAEPLGCLAVDSHYDVKAFEELPGYKTNQAGRREVPVHATLAKLLARWKLSGWAAMNGRPPTPEDLIIEAPRGGVLNSNRTLLDLKHDCALLGLRQRRQHDSRRTFITLARASGAVDTFLRWVTHGPPENEDILDDYTTPPWPVLCEQVAKVKLGLLGGARLEALSYSAATVEGMSRQNATFASGLGGTRTPGEAPSGEQPKRVRARSGKGTSARGLAVAAGGSSVCSTVAAEEDEP